MKKRVVVFLSLLLVFLLIFSGVVSAKSTADKVKDFGNDVMKIVTPLATALLGQPADGRPYWEGDLLFAKILLFVMLVAIVWSVLKNSRVTFFQNRGILAVLSIGAGILSIRWLTGDIVDAILLPYTALGVAVSAGIPFIIFFFVINVGLRKSLPIVRRIAWVVFAVVFMGLWIARRSTLGEGVWIYPLTAVLALIMAWADGTVSRFFAKLKVEREMDADRYHSYARLLREYKKIQKMVSQAKLDGDGAMAQRLGKRLGNLHQALISLEGR